MCAQTPPWVIRDSIIPALRDCCSTGTNSQPPPGRGFGALLSSSASPSVLLLPPWYFTCLLDDVSLNARQNMPNIYGKIFPITNLPSRGIPVVSPNRFWCPRSLTSPECFCEERAVWQMDFSAFPSLSVWVMALNKTQRYLSPLHLFSQQIHFPFWMLKTVWWYYKEDIRWQSNPQIKELN